MELQYRALWLHQRSLTKLNLMVLLPVSFSTASRVCPQRLLVLLSCWPAAVVAHVQWGIKGTIPVNNEQVGFCLGANNQQVGTPTPPQSHRSVTTPWPSSPASSPSLFVHSLPLWWIILSLLLSLFSSFCPFTFNFAYFNLLSQAAFSQTWPPLPSDSVVHSSARTFPSVCLLSLALSGLLRSDRRVIRSPGISLA